MTQFLDPVREVADPALSAERLSVIAAERPDLGAAVAQHPNAYESLLDWLAAHGDERARSAVARRRMPAPPAPPAVPAPPAPPEPAASYSATAPFAPQTAPVTPYASAIAAGPTVTAGAPVDTSSTPARRPRRRKGLVVGLVAGGLVVALAGGGLVWANSVGLFGGAPSPEAAVEKGLRGITELDPIALLTAFAPSETSALRPAVEAVGDIDAGEGVDYLGLIQQLRDAGDVTTAGLTFETEQIAKGVVAVSLVSGTITVEGDAEKIAAALIGLSEQTMRSFMTQQWGYDEVSAQNELDRQRDELAQRVEAQLPLTFDIAAELDRMGGEFDPDAPVVNPFTVVTVDEGGWYISPVLSAAEAVARDRARWTGQTLAQIRGGELATATSFATPEAAAQGTAEAVTDFFTYGDVEALASVLPLAERRLVSLYADVWVEPQYLRDYGPELTVDNVSVSPQVSGDRAEVEIDDLAFTLTSSDYDWETSLRIHGTCWQWSHYGWSDSRDGSGCLADVPALTRLGLDDAHLIMVRENGGWLVSPIQTLAQASADASAALAALADAGRLEELWGTR